MKKLFHFLALFVAATICAMPMQLLAQDTLNVAATPAGNINTVINGDTLAGGVRAHPNRVYRLTRGSVYQVTEPIKINGSLNIVATAGTNRPPVLAPAILIDNSSIDHFFEFIGRGAKVAINDIYLLSVRADQNWLGWSAGIRIWADSVTMKLRGVIFDAFSESGIRIYAHWTKLDVQDCKFRNHQHSSSWFGGQPFMTEAPNALDTVKFINNTFFCNSSYLWSIRGYDRRSIFEHNTLVYGVVNPFLTRQGSHMIIRNNLFYAMHAFGGNPDHVWGGWFLNWPDTVSSGIIQIRANSVWNGIATTGPEAYVDAAHGVTASMLSPTDRTVDLRNNVYCFPKKLTDFYKAYNDTVKTRDSIDFQIGGGKGYILRTIIPPRWINDLGKATLDSIIPAQGGHVTQSGNFSADPGFNATVTNQCDKLNTYMNKICTNTLDSTWHFKPSGVLYPPVWPVPEDLAYTNTTLLHAGTDGFAVGDLNWFPDQKAAWVPTDVKPVDPLPQEFTLSQNYPNPFNPSTTIKYQIAQSGMTTLKVYNVLGQEVASLVDGVVSAGSYQTTFDASLLSSGIYFYTLRSGSFVETKKMMLVK